ncbi:Fc.00g071090.m01.CDS01 [Cosmosporella sp. VM-42]
MSPRSERSVSPGRRFLEGDLSDVPSTSRFRRYLDVSARPSETTGQEGDDSDSSDDEPMFGGRRLAALLGRPAISPIAALTAEEADVEADNEEATTDAALSQEDMQDIPLDSLDDEDSDLSVSWERTHRPRLSRPPQLEESLALEDRLSLYDRLSRRPQPPPTGLSRLNPWRPPPCEPLDGDCIFDDEDVQLISSHVEDEVVFEDEEHGYTTNEWFVPRHLEPHERVEEWTWEQRHPYQARAAGFVEAVRDIPLVQEAEQNLALVRQNAVLFYDVAARHARGPARTALELAIVTGQVTHWLGGLAIAHGGELAVVVSARVGQAMRHRIPIMRDMVIQVIQERMPVEVPLAVRRPQLAWRILQQDVRWTADHWREYRDLLREAFLMLPPLEGHVAMVHGRRRR